MNASALLAEVPGAARDLVIGHWPEQDVPRMRARGDLYIETGRGLHTAADQYEVDGKDAEEALQGATRSGLSERNRTVVAAMRNQAAVCEDMGRQCHDVADLTEQTQHLLIVTGIVLGVQLAYDALLFLYGGGFKALADRLAAEQAMRAAVTRLVTTVATRAAAGTARRAALHGAVHAAKIGALTSVAISVGAQVWDLETGVRDEFDMGSLGEMVAGGIVGGVVGAEVGRRVAPRVLGRLGGRATGVMGRFTAHIGGTMLIGGAGGVTGGIAGAIPSLIIHYENIHSFGDMFKMVRESAVVGFGSGFVGAAGSALRVHRAGVGGVRGNTELAPIARRQLDFGSRVDRLLAGEPPGAEPLARQSTLDNSARTAELLTFPDGSQIVHKVVSDPRHAHAEFLASVVGDAVGARVPAVHIDGRHVYMEVVPGKNAHDAYPRDWTPENRFHGTPSASRLGVLDAVIDVPDRNAENWMVDPTGDVWGIDHSLAFEPDGRIGAFAKQFLDHGPAEGTVQWKEHDFSRAEVSEIRQRVDELQPVFSALGRNEWHEGVIQRLDGMAEAAPPPSSTESRGVVPPPHGPGDIPGQPRRTTVDTQHQIPGDRRTGPDRVPPRDNRAESGDQRAQVRPPARQDRSIPRVDAAEDHAPGRRDSRSESVLPPRTVDVRTTADGQPADGAPVPREESYDGPPTRPLSRTAPDNRPTDRDAYDLAAAPPPGQTQFFRHPDSGHVDVVFTPRGGNDLPLRLMPGNEYVLGSGRDALLHGMTSEFVSRRHATLRVDDAGHVFLRDDNSRNGTFVDGKQLSGGEWVRVYDGQQLMLSRDFDLGLDFRRQVADVRLFGNDAPPLRLHRGQSMGIGRDFVQRPNNADLLTMSKDHVVVGMDDDGRVWIQDDGSTNGTKVNDEPLGPGEQRTLRPGDSLRFGLARGEAQFLPADGSIEAPPIQMRFGNGPDAIPMQLQPGRSVLLGTDQSSPFARQLSRHPGVSEQHATLGMGYEGRVWIRDHPGSGGVWVNGDRIAPNQRVTLNEGDRVGLGNTFVAPAHLGGTPVHPPAVVHFAPELRLPPIRLDPGQEAPVQVRYMVGESNRPSNAVQNIRTGVREVFIGRDPDGRVWVRDPEPELRPATQVNGRALEAGEKRYIGPEDTLSIDGRRSRLEVGEERPLSLRLSDNRNLDPLYLRRGEEILIGRDPASPLADQLRTNHSVSPQHATIFRDAYGNLMVRDNHSEQGTYVNGLKVDPDAPPVPLRPGDSVRFGDWVGGAQYANGETSVTPKNTTVKLNSSHGDRSFELPRGGEPMVLGRSNPALPTGDRVSWHHAEVGVHPSGRVWIRDESSTNGTRINETTIAPGTQMTLHPGDHVDLGGGYDFTVAFPPPEGGPFVDIMDSSPETEGVKEALAALTHIHSHIYQRVSEHMNAVPGGGIVIGNRPLLDMPGSDSLRGHTPFGRKPGTSWNNVQGVYMGGPRRIIINTGGDSGSANVVWHEFGHATDAAYGTGGRWLSAGPEWSSLHADMLQALDGRGGWNSYYNKPAEAFAEAFTAWVHGGTSKLETFTLGDRVLAHRLKAYFDRVL
ncbi:FHA domain-containing protein [Nocardia sp. NBC_01329]|uniref:FHA domain-containing protein n=1 Tax=Nocardia sp. NBC_01329 TaxID=2903594 RepID=UPI002E160754|nr:FHA domain-containing protein [Nocardia sp. NBC_01329]